MTELQMAHLRGSPMERKMVAPRALPMAPMKVQMKPLVGRDESLLVGIPLGSTDGSPDGPDEARTEWKGEGLADGSPVGI
jgi:hypothetical protein